jgi:peptidoglycan/xylan/chitin deacetylase (PgdA/CDA1 family)
MFEASHPFAFLDYFRVPYDLRPPDASPGVAPAVASLGSLRVAGYEDSVGKSLIWLRADASRMMPKTCRLGRFELADCTLFGHVAHDAAVQDLLRPFGNDWCPTDVITADERPIAAIWRDSDGNVFLPFDPGEVMQYFWTEKYRGIERSAMSTSLHTAALRSYYLIRPILPRPLQLMTRRIFMRVQGRSSFPGWPIEDSLHSFYAWLFTQVTGIAGRPVPFIDPWPDGRSWALVLTHDVETDVGCRNMDLLRDLERERGYRSSWNFVPLRYHVGDDIVRAIQDQGCEVGVHGLRHDGRDLSSERMMERRLPAMRAHAESWKAVGFRSPGTQRHWKLMPRLGFEYDSSYSDTDPYEPQPGGCCTYLPYFNEEMVELPITMPQDHTLFVILQHTDANVWLRKANLVRERRGMVLILTHPDYADNPLVVEGYRELLDEFRDDDTVWHALPREVASWWRRRAASSIRDRGGDWCIDGPAAVDGKVRFATPGWSYVDVGGRQASQPGSGPSPVRPE